MKLSYIRSQIMAMSDEELDFLAGEDLQIHQWSMMGNRELRKHIIALLEQAGRLLSEPEPKPEPELKPLIKYKSPDDPLFDKCYLHLADSASGNSGPSSSLPLPTRRRSSDKGPRKIYVDRIYDLDPAINGSELLEAIREAKEMLSKNK